MSPAVGYFPFSYIYSFLLPTWNGFCRPKLLVGCKDAYISSRIPVKKYSQVLLSKIKKTIKLCDKKCEIILLLLFSPEWWHSMRSSWCPSASWWSSQVKSHNAASVLNLHDNWELFRKDDDYHSVPLLPFPGAALWLQKKSLLQVSIFSILKWSDIWRE